MVARTSGYDEIYLKTAGAGIARSVRTNDYLAPVLSPRV